MKINLFFVCWFSTSLVSLPDDGDNGRRLLCDACMVLKESQANNQSDTSDRYSLVEFIITTDMVCICLH